jgi:large subunit ribosomal protein L21
LGVDKARIMHTVPRFSPPGAPGAAQWIWIMFAVIKTGGKQYRVAADDIITVEKLEGEPGQRIAFDHVLMIADGEKVQIGAPALAGARVHGELIETAKGEKVMVFKKRRRSTYRRKRGHRQVESKVRITGVSAA